MEETEACQAFKRCIRYPRVLFEVHSMGLVSVISAKTIGLVIENIETSRSQRGLPDIALHIHCAQYLEATKVFSLFHRLCDMHLKHVALAPSLRSRWDSIYFMLSPHLPNHGYVSK
jgi:hypothetical protein